jgi:hypothetical protein
MRSTEMTGLGQERSNTNRSLGSRRFTETDDATKWQWWTLTRPAPHWTHTDRVTMPDASRHDEVVCSSATRGAIGPIGGHGHRLT